MAPPRLLSSRIPSATPVSQMSSPIPFFPTPPSRESSPRILPPVTVTECHRNESRGLESCGLSSRRASFSRRGPIRLHPPFAHPLVPHPPSAGRTGERESPQVEAQTFCLGRPKSKPRYVEPFDRRLRPSPIEPRSVTQPQDIKVDSKYEGTKIKAR